MAIKTIDTNDLIVKNVTYKMKHQWILSIDKIDAFTIRNVSRPEITFEEVVINHINGKIYQAGKAEFSTMSLTLQEPIAPSASQKVMSWINTQYDWATGRMGLPELYKINFSILELSGPGTVVSEWQIEGAWLQGVTFNELASDDSSPTEINLTVRFDYFYLLY